MALTLRVLLENRRAAGANPLLQAKAGLSLLIEDDTTSILFDTGPDDSFLRNAALMGVDLSRITATVLSHGHYDHCGGVAWLPDNSRIICHPQVGDERYAALKVLGHTRKIKKLSLDIDYSRHRMQYSREPLAIGDRFMWSGEIAVPAPRAYGVIAGENAAVDYVIDEGVLIYKSDPRLDRRFSSALCFPAQALARPPFFAPASAGKDYGLPLYRRLGPAMAAGRYRAGHRR